MTAADVTREPISHLMTFSRHLEQFDDEMLVFIKNYSTAEGDLELSVI